MYVRFVIQKKDPDSGRRQGLFQAIQLLESHATLRPEERALLDETYSWFKQSLRVPDRLSRSARPHAHRVALSWYKDSAANTFAG